MAREVPEVVRAVAGLAAAVVDEAKKLPEQLPGLPVRVIGLAMQTAMKVQQGYSGLVARGDEVFTGIRGDQEPGLATFDDEVEAQSGGYRESAFDRADVSFQDNEVAGLPDQETGAAVSAVEELADQIATAQETLDRGAAEAPSTAEVLDEIAIDEMVDVAPATGGTATTPLRRAKRAATKQAAKKAPPAKKAAAKKAAPAKKQSRARAAAADTEVVSTGEVVVDEAIGAEAAPEERPAAESAAAEAPAAETPTETPAAGAAASDEGGTTVAAATGVRTDVGEPDTSAEDSAAAEGASVDAVGGESAAPTDDVQGGSEISGSQAAGTAPVEGYDSWSIAQLRGRMRGYARSTVQDVLDYEQATRAREPYLRMLRNRLERLE
jgi:hypothetical protein